MLVVWIACSIVPIALVIAISYFVDKHAHDGVSALQRRRVRRDGIAADATVISEEILTRGGSRYSLAYSLVYEIRTPDATTVRAKGIEILYSTERSVNNILPGAHVQVRFDPATNIAVLVRNRYDRRSRRAEDDARKAREAALLSGGGPGR